MGGDSRTPARSRYWVGPLRVLILAWSEAMNTKITAAFVKGTRRRGCGLYFAVCVFPGSALCLPSSSSSMAGHGDSRPYLLVIGPPALRFREAIVPQPDLSTRPPAGGPPHHPFSELSAGLPAATKAEAASPGQKGASSAPAAQDASGQKATPDTGPTPSPILPDDVRPKVRPEDFLPFFQFPGSRPNPEDVSSVPTAPAPGMQPPSSATYKQQ
jgi:hypothetical protein